MSRGIWDRETVALLIGAALLPLALAWVWTESAVAVSRLVFVFLLMSGWQVVFLIARAQPPSWSMIASALAIAMLVPEGLGPVPLALGISFGFVIGELVFGGWGRNLLHPAAVTLAFLGFGFPAYDWPYLLTPVAWAALPAALMGIAFGVMPGGVILAAALLGGFAVAFGVIPVEVAEAAGIVLVLIVADPVASATSRLGRWLNGGLYAALIILFAVNWTGAAAVQIAVAAALLASLAAPVLDEAAIALWVARRRKKHGRT